MDNRIRFQKEIFFRALQLHCLRSRTDNMDLIRIVIDDPLVFELAYEKILRRWVVENEEKTIVFGEAASGIHPMLLPNSFVWMRWLTEQREILIDEIHAIVQCLGGIEVANFLMDEESVHVVGRCQV